MNVTASDMSDIASRVWATTEGTRVDSRILVIQSAVSDVDSQVLLNASMISDVDSALTLHDANLSAAVSDTQSAIAALNDPTAATIADAVWDEPYSDHLTASTTGSRLQNVISSISDVDSALTLHDANISAAVSDAHSAAILGASHASDAYSVALLNQSAISDLDSQITLHTSTLSDIDSQLTVNFDLISDVDSQVLLNASSISDVQSQLDVTHSLLSDVESQLDAVWTTQLTESYNTDGTAPTAAQALFMTMQMLTEFSISGTTLTMVQLDGTTTAATFTLDDDTNPTSLTRAS